MQAQRAIYVDADACPVKAEVEEVVTEFDVRVVMVSSVAHQISGNDATEIVTTDSEAEAVDLAIVNRISKNDIVVTQDYGLASMCLGKGALALNPRGKIVDESNIDRLLAQRHEFKRASRSAGRRRPKSRVRAFSDADRTRFVNSLKKLLQQ